MIRRPRYVIAVQDLERSTGHYRDCLGFKVHETGDPGTFNCPMFAQFRMYRRNDYRRR
jgi:hypothetical protein